MSLNIILMFNLILVQKNKCLNKNEGFLDTKQYLGAIGEHKVFLTLKNVITKEHGEVINNLMLQSKNFSTQIDHLIIGNNQKIIIVETKNYKGEINGNVKDEYWTQTILDKTYEFKNPINQNSYHKSALEQLFHWYNISYNKIIHIVVFTNEDCRLNVKSDFVVKLDELEDVLNKFIKPSDGDISNISELLNRKNQSNNKTAVQKHDNFIKKKLIRA